MLNINSDINRIYTNIFFPLKENKYAHIEVLFDDLPLQLVAQLVMNLIAVEEINGLPWAEDD